MTFHWTLKNLVITLLLLMNTSMTDADELNGHISVLIGLKTMESQDWPDLDRHFSMGLLFDLTKDSWPISLVVDILDTGDEYNHSGMKDLGHTTEHHLGVRKFFKNQHSKITPYIGGGVSFMYAEQEIEVNNVTTTEDDRAVGGWLGAGIYYQVNPKFVLGLDGRYSQGEVTLFNKDRNAGGINIGFTGGYKF